ncbi:hypothetical protein AAE478_004126 [Parahypoxylon ruwenzoriense]
MIDYIIVSETLPTTDNVNNNQPKGSQLVVAKKKIVYGTCEPVKKMEAKKLPTEEKKIQEQKDEVKEDSSDSGQESEEDPQLRRIRQMMIHQETMAMLILSITLSLFFWFLWYVLNVIFAGFAKVNVDTTRGRYPW